MSRFRTKLLRAAFRTTLAFPESAIVRIIGQRASTYRGQTLHPRLQVGLDLMKRLRAPEMNDGSPEEARIRANAYYDLLDIPKTPIHSVEDNVIDGPGGAIPVRIYKPESLDHPAPVLLYFHGGGFVIGDIEGYDRPCRKLADLAQCAVISVGYRLAPEHKFPAGFDDCWAVYDWVRTQGQQWDLDTTRIALSGDSAGGNLAAGVAQKARDTGGQQPNLQVLIYPRTDSANIWESNRDLRDGNYILTGALMSWFKNHTVRTPEDVHDVRMSPILCKDYEALPPAVLITCGFDPLWDEGEAYGDALRGAGIAVEHIHLPELIHGVWSFGGIFKCVETLHARVATHVRAAHQNRLELDPERVLIQSD